MKALRGLLRIFRWLLLVGALTVLFLILWQGSPPSTTGDAAAPARVESKLAELQRAREDGKPHTLALDEAELNALLASNLELMRDPSSAAAAAQGPQPQAAQTEPAEAAPAAAAAPAPRPGQEPSLEQVQSNVRDVKVNLFGDKVRGYVAFDLYGKEMSLMLEGRLGVKEGYLHLKPTAGKLGSLPLPRASLDAAVRRLLESPKNREQLRLPPEIAGVRVERGELKVQYR